MDIPVIEPAVISRYVPEHREEYQPPKLYRRTEMDTPQKTKTPTVLEVVTVLESFGPMTRSALAEKLEVSGRDLAKTLHYLLQQERVSEVDGLCFVPQRGTPVQETTETPQERVSMADSMAGSAAVEKAHSSPVSGPLAGMVDEASIPTGVQNQHGSGSQGLDTDAALENALRIILQELPGLLADRQKLHRVLEVVG